MEDLLQTSVPSLSFKNAPIGTSYSGVLLEPLSLVQGRDFETGNPATWPSGDPKMSVVAKLRMDDGEERSLWATKPSAMLAALSAAQKVLGRQTQPGDRWTITFTGEVPNQKNPALNPVKQYTAQIAPGAPAAVGDLLGGQPQQQAQPQAQQFQQPPAQQFQQPQAQQFQAPQQPQQQPQQAPQQFQPQQAQPQWTSPTPEAAYQQPQPMAQQAPQQPDPAAFAATLGAQPVTQPQPQQAQQQVSPDTLGAALGNLTPEQRTALGL